MKTGLRAFIAVLLLVSVALLAGCGSGSFSTSGSIVLATPTASNGVVTALATYAPVTGTTLAGQEVFFAWYIVGKSSGNKTDFPTVKSTTNSSGLAQAQLTLNAPRSEIYIAYVKAETGGLSSGWQSVEVPQ